MSRESRASLGPGGRRWCEACRQPGIAASSRAARRAFTLVELMAVVAISGVLALVGIMVFRRHIFAVKSTEASGMLESIRAADERWRAENNSYFDVSQQSFTTYYPNFPGGKPGTTKVLFYDPADTSDLGQRWRLLNPTSPGLVQFGYAVVAGPPGTATLPKPSTTLQPAWVQPTTDNWYIIQAMGDTDGDGKFAFYLASSFSGDIYSENEGE